MVVEWNEYVHKPIRIKAFKWDGTDLSLDAFTPEDRQRFGLRRIGKMLCIDTLRGIAYAHVGDWIAFAPWGEVWPIKPHVFEQAYESAGE